MLRTLGEMLVWPAVPTAAAQMAPTGQEGRYQEWVASATWAGRMVAGVARPCFYGWMVAAYLVALGAYLLYGQLAIPPSVMNSPGAAASGG